MAGRKTVEQRADVGGRPLLTTTSWDASAQMSFAEWVEHGRRLGLMGRSAGWWIGDWLAFGNTVYGERYTRAARVTGYDVQTLMNMVYVASRVESGRRHERLSWSHHAEVVALPPAEQDAWLERAELDRMSVRCLREAIRQHRRTLAAAVEAELTAPEGVVEELRPTAPEQRGEVLEAGSSAAAALTAAASVAVVSPRTDAAMRCCPSCGHTLATER